MARVMTWVSNVDRVTGNTSEFYSDYLARHHESVWIITR